MINMDTEQSFLFPDEGKKFSTKPWQWAIPFQEDRENFDERYKKAEMAFCQSLMVPYQEKFLL
jgi:hypothetical protein